MCFLAVSFQLKASPITISHLFSGQQNDCAGVFELGNGFNTCNIFVEGGTGLEISPIIAKYETDGSGWETANGFASVTGDEWAGSDPFAGSGGDWMYTQGPGDPGVRFWAAKASDGFTLFWTIDDGAELATCDAGANYFTETCLNFAMVVNSGSWATEGGKDLSHISFYNHEDVVPCDPSDPDCNPEPPCDPSDPDCNPEPPSEIPEPATLLLFGIGILGLGVGRMRKAGKAIK